MRINFFEEFPTKENLKKLKFIGFPSTVYIAAKSLNDFYKIKNSIKKKNIEFAYWPVLSKEEGYWFSAFSKTEGIKRIIQELEQNKKKLTVLWDAELPSLRKRLFITNLSNIFRNRKMILNFLKTASGYNLQVFTAEYPLSNWCNNWLFKFFAIRHPDKDKRIYMVYSSHLKGLEKYFEKGKKRIGVGVIAVGILGTEEPITPGQLDRDLELAKNNNVEEITIFRLGGLNKEYLNVIKKHI